MSHGNYSDDPLENSLFRDDVLRMQEEMDEELNQYESEQGEDKRGHTAAVISLVFVMVLFEGFSIKSCLY